MAPHSFRLAATADVRAIAELHVRAWRAAYRGLLPDVLLDTQSVDWRERQWRDWNSGHRLRQIWLVERDAALLGFAATGPSRDAGAPASTGEVYAIYIEPGVIGTGVGRALFTHASAALHAQGFTRAMLWVLETNARSRRFYEAAGWRPDGGHKTETLRGVDVPNVRYACALS
jgi:GNAT superfamily N-acetyltransferase